MVRQSILLYVEEISCDFAPSAWKSTQFPLFPIARCLVSCVSFFSNVFLAEHRNKQPCVCFSRCHRIPSQLRLLMDKKQHVPCRGAALLHDSDVSRSCAICCSIHTQHFRFVSFLSRFNVVVFIYCLCFKYKQGLSLFVRSGRFAILLAASWCYLLSLLIQTTRFFSASFLFSISFVCFMRGFLIISYISGGRAADEPPRRRRQRRRWRQQQRRLFNHHELGHALPFIPHRRLAQPIGDRRDPCR